MNARIPGFATVLSAAALFAVAGSAAAEVFPSKVTRAILYPDMAEVTRTVSVDRPSATVELAGLPAGIRPESLSARVVGGQASIVGFTLEDTFRTEPAPGKVLDLEKQLETLTDARRTAEGAVRASRRETELLDQGIQALYRGEAAAPSGKDAPKPARLTPPEIEAALALYRARVEAIDGLLLKQEQEIRALDRKIAAAQRELDKVRNPDPTREKKVVITLSRAVECKVALTYLTGDAGFAPRYNVRLSPGAGTIAFELAGDAWQRSGEDWTDVTMSVSSARPGRMAQLPPLPPWDVDFRAPVEVMKSARAMPMMAMRAPAAKGAMMDKEMEMAEEDGTIPPPAPPGPVAQRRFASFEVSLDGPQSLPGSGEKKALLLARREQKSAVSWLSIPKAADGAFVTAEGKNESGLPLIQAPAALFLEDGFVGAGFVTDAAGRPVEVPEGAAFRIGFGKDPSLQAVRKETLRQRDEGGMFARFKRIRYRYEYTVTNFRKEPATLTMLDRVPVPHNKEIEVKDVDAPGATVGGKAPGKEPGEVRWELALAPGEKRTLSLSFAVEYPVDREVDGL